MGRSQALLQPLSARLRVWGPTVQILAPVRHRVDAWSEPGLSGLSPKGAEETGTSLSPRAQWCPESGAQPRHRERLRPTGQQNLQGHCKAAPAFQPRQGRAAPTAPCHAERCSLWPEFRRPPREGPRSDWRIENHRDWLSAAAHGPAASSLCRPLESIETTAPRTPFPITWPIEVAEPWTLL